MSQAQDFYNTVRREYKSLRDGISESEVAVLRYYTPAGEEIRVNTMQLEEGTNTVVIYGDDGANYCVVIAPTQNAHLMLRVIQAEEATEVDRRPIGFN